MKIENCRYKKNQNFLIFEFNIHCDTEKNES